MNHDPSFESFLIEKDNQTVEWLMNLEVSNQKQSIPADLYEKIKLSLWEAFRRDPNMIIEEFDFYLELSPRM